MERRREEIKKREGTGSVFREDRCTSMSYCPQQSIERLTITDLDKCGRV